MKSRIIRSKVSTVSPAQSQRGHFSSDLGQPAYSTKKGAVRLKTIISFGDNRPVVFTGGMVGRGRKKYGTHRKYNLSRLVLQMNPRGGYKRYRNNCRGECVLHTRTEYLRQELIQLIAEISNNRDT